MSWAWKSIEGLAEEEHVKSRAAARAPPEDASPRRSDDRRSCWTRSRDWASSWAGGSTCSRRPLSASCAPRRRASGWSTGFMPSFKTTSRICCLKVQRPIFIDLIQLHDDIGKMIDARVARRCRARAIRRRPRHSRIDPDRDRRHPLPPGRRAVRARGRRTFDPRKQRAVSTQATDDPALNKTVAARLRKGFRAGDKLIRPEIVSVFTFRQTPVGSSATSDVAPCGESASRVLHGRRSLPDRTAQSWARSMVVSWKFSQSSVIPSHEPSWARSASKTSRKRAIRSGCQARRLDLGPPELLERLATSRRGTIRWRSVRQDGCLDQRLDGSGWGAAAPSR